MYIKFLYLMNYNLNEKYLRQAELSVMKFLTQMKNSDGKQNYQSWSS